MNKRPDEGADSFEQLHDEEAHHEELRPIRDEMLIQQIKETADKLLRDHANRGDIKLLSTALKELRYAFKILAPFRHRRKVTVFGSARIKCDHPAYIQAVEFGKQAAAEGYMIITGAASGIMEAGHVVHGRENSIGINILLPFEQSANPIIAGDLKLMHLKYFFTRKLVFVKESDAVALFPGGFGTQDEGFEVLTLVQTGKSHLFPIVMVDLPEGGYWGPWDAYVKNVLLAQGMISPSDLALYKLTHSVEEAMTEIRNFYRVYHSMRYVKKDLVLRLNHRLSPTLLSKICRDFSDIVVSGSFTQTDALPLEANDEHVAKLPRLKFHFDRRQLGRLRMLIDLVNQEG